MNSKGKGSWKGCRKFSKKSKNGGVNKKGGSKKKREEGILGEEEESLHAVIFIQHTENSELTARIRRRLENLDEIQAVHKYWKHFFILNFLGTRRSYK